MELEELYNIFYQDKILKDPKDFIKIYEANIGLVDDTDIYENDKNYDAIMRITSDYAISLVKIGNLKKSIPYLNKSIELFNKHPKIKKDELLEINMYEDLLFYRGFTLYETEKTNQASEDFEILVKNFPDNDRYKNWLAGCKTKKYSIYESVFWGLACLSYIIGLFFEKQLGEHHLKVLFLTIVFVVLGVSFMGYRYLIRRKIKNVA